MLFQLVIIRMSPLLLFKLCKNKKQMEWMVFFCGILLGTGVLLGTGKIFESAGWKGILLLPIAIFPQYIFYGFAMWMILRCVFKDWSFRVWRRIFRLSLVIVFLGILTEFYINSKILQIFFKIFK